MIVKKLNQISTISCIIDIVLLYIFIILSNSLYFNGCVILLFLLLMLNPITNICSINKKIIKNPIFHIMILTYNGCISYILIRTIKIYIEHLNDTSNNSISSNMSTLFFYDKLIYILIATIIILIITFLFKKENIKSYKDNSQKMLLIIFITALIPLLNKGIWTMNFISAGFNITLIIFTIISLLKAKNMNLLSELKKYYMILIITSIISINPISLVLSTHIYFQLDTFGSHI